MKIKPGFLAIISLMAVMIPYAGFSQSGVAINSSNLAADGSAMLDISSSTKGVLIPRVALSSANSSSPVTGPATSLLVYNTATAGIFPNNVTPGFYYWNGSQWERIVTGAINSWNLTGNSGTDPMLHFLGTTDYKNLRIATNSSAAMYFNVASNFVGIGDENPGDNLVLNLDSRAVLPFPSGYSGMLIKSPFTANAVNNVGLHIGLDHNNFYSTARIMNYGTGDIWFGLNDYEVMRLKNNSHFMGLGTDDPKDNLTIRLNPAAVVGSPDSYSGILMYSPYQNGMGNNKGLHIGLDHSLFSTARILNNENGDLWIGTNATEMITLKPVSRNVGVNINNPYHAFSVKTGTAAIFSGPYDGIHVVNPFNPNMMNTGIVIGTNNSAAYEDKGIWNYDNGEIAFGTNNLERMHIAANGNVGIGMVWNGTAHSTLQVDGTVAVGVTMGVAGASSASPTSIDAYGKSYVGLSPVGANAYYELPNPASYTGRIYYIRNNSDTYSAWVRSLSGLICPGSGTCLSAGTYYELKPTTSVKTIICISDGVNWTVGKID